LLKKSFKPSLRAKRSNLAVHNDLENRDCRVANIAPRNDTRGFFNSLLENNQPILTAELYMLGAIAGDIIGSVYESNNIKTKEFSLFDPRCHFTDDTVLTVALADAILSNNDYAARMKSYFHRYPNAGYGASFYQWALSSSDQPYYSYGNGAAMRTSPVGWAFESLAEVLEKAGQFSEVTHNHPQGIKGARVTAAAVFLARTGRSKEEIRSYIETTFHYDLSGTLDEIRPGYVFDVSCQGTVPPAIRAFLESRDFEDAIRNAISLGGDSDTLACITGGIAEAFYGGVPRFISEKVWEILDPDLREVTLRFRKKYVKYERPLSGHDRRVR
jgi:ADP-ribosylglycohydrolase